MRRQRVLRNTSAQSLCIFCACRLGVDVPSTQLAPFVSTSRRALNTFRSQPQEAGAASATSGANGRTSGSAQDLVFDPDSSLTRAEQQERARRAALGQEHGVQEHQSRQQQIWRDHDRRHQQNQGPSLRVQRNLTTDSAARNREPQVTRGSDQSERRFVFRRTNRDRNIGVKSILPASSSDGKKESNPNIQTKDDISQSRQVKRQSNDQAEDQHQKRSENTSRRTGPFAERKQPKIAMPAFLKSSEPAQGSQQVSGWGMGATETKPLEYGDGTQPRPRTLVDAQDQNPAIQDARDGARAQFGPGIHKPKGAAFWDIHADDQQVQHERQVQEQQAQAARKRLEQEPRPAPERSELDPQPVNSAPDHWEDQIRRGDDAVDRKSSLQRAPDTGPQMSQSAPAPPPSRSQSFDSDAPQRRPQLYFSMSDAQEYKYDRDYANHDSRVVSTPSNGMQQTAYARSETRVPMSNRYEATAQNTSQPYWPQPLPTYTPGSERDEYNPAYRISESRARRGASSTYDGNWSSFEDEQYGDAGPDPMQNRPAPPVEAVVPDVPSTSRHYGDELAHSQNNQLPSQQEQKGSVGWGLDDSYDGIPLDAAQRRPEPHPSEVGRYPQHVPRNARTFGFEEEHRQDPFYAERRQPPPQHHMRREAPPPSRFSGSFEGYENIQYDAPSDPAGDAHSRQYNRPPMGEETFGSFDSDGYYESQYQYPDSRGPMRNDEHAPQQVSSRNRSAFSAPHYHQEDQRRGGFGYDSFGHRPSGSQSPQQYQDYDRRGVSQPFGDGYGPPSRTDHNDDDDGGQASFYNRQPAPLSLGGSGYRAEPVDLHDFSQNMSSAEVDNSANWQHLRRRKTQPVSPPAQYQAHPPPKQALSNQEIDQMFANHVQQRETLYAPPPPLRPRGAESSSANFRVRFLGRDSNETKVDHIRNAQNDYGDRHANKRCARCGQMGHIARDCSSPPRLNQRQGSGLRVRHPDTAADVSGTQGNEKRYNASSASRASQAVKARDTAFQLPSEGGETTQGAVESTLPDQEESAKRTSRRSRWADDENVEEEDTYSGKRKDKRGARRQSNDNDDDDERRSARDEYRARKAQRQSKEEAERLAGRKAAQRERAARRAEAATPIVIPEFVSVQHLSQMLGVRYEQFVEHLEDLGYDDVFPGKTLNSETSGMIAMEYNFEPTFDTGVHEEEERDLKPRPEVEDKEYLPVRPPVVTIMGHVDHGKTTILDYLRKSSVAAGEAGGITQHIGAFSVPLASSGKTITFLDTPGHAAFLAMRQRGATVTDIVILVVAADDSVKPQTLEALKHARAAGVPIIVAINKIDKEEADIERCKQDLARHGVEIEDYGGDTQVVSVSGKTGRGMDELEETVVTLSEILDHRAETDGPVEGWVLEATTKKAGRVATILVRRGTLRPGSFIVAGKTWARIRTLRNEGGIALTEVGPGMPVEVDGWKDQPMAGDEVLQAPSEQKANSVVEYRLELAERERIAQDTEAINEARRIEQQKREKEKAAEQLAKRAAQDVDDGDPVLGPSSGQPTQQTESGQMIVPFIIKADVSGSVEAVSAYMLSVSNPLIAPQVLSAGVGAVHESDIELANAAQGHIIAFNLPADQDMRGLAESRGVRILENNIIYRVLDDVKAVLEEKLPPVVTQRVLGEAEVSAAFEINIGGRKTMRIAGCKVRNGVVARNARVRITRGGEKVYDGTIDSLKNVKKDVQEMRKGSECGVGFDAWEAFEVGDQVQTYVELEEKRKL